jgi:hypothetical protein
MADGVGGLLAGREALLRDACGRAVAYLGGLAGRRVAPAAAEVAALRRLDFALPGPGMDAVAVLAADGWDAAGQGLVGAPPVTVVVGAQVHTTVRKALGLIGLGRDRAIVLPADDQGRIEPRGLPALTGPALVCLQPGTSTAAPAIRSPH